MTTPKREHPISGQLLRRYREERKLTQEALAELVSTTPQTISNYERGISRPNDRNMVIHLVRVLVLQGVNLDVQIKKANDLLTSYDYTQLSSDEIRHIFGQENLTSSDSEESLNTHRHLRMLVVLPAPVADHTGKEPPKGRVLNIWSEWQWLRQAVEHSRNVAIDTHIPWLVIRLVPPTADGLFTALALGHSGYQVVHIRCNSSPEGLLLEDTLGRERLLPSVQLVNAFSGTKVQLVVLNAGATFDLGKALVESAGIPAVIVTKQPLNDNEARVLSEKLYHYLTVGATVGEALQEVRRNIIEQIEVGDISVRGDPQQHVNNLVLIGDEHLRLETGNLIDAEPCFVLDPTPHNDLPLDLLAGFVGRSIELVTLAKWFAQGNSCIFALTGIGGLGKTSLALNIALRNAYRFSALIFARANESPDFGPREVLQKINKVLRLTSTPDEADDPVSALTRRLNARAILLILDNLESLSPQHTSELAQVMQNLDPRGPSRVLMTLRPHDHGELTKSVKANRIDLSVLTHTDALRLAWDESRRWQINLTAQSDDRPWLPDTERLEDLARDAHIINVTQKELALLDKLVSLAFCHPKLIQLAVATFGEYGWMSTQQWLECLRGREIEEALEDYIGQVLDDLIQRIPECMDILHAMLVFPEGAEVSRLCTVVLGKDLGQGNAELMDFEEQRLYPIIKTNLLRHVNRRYSLDPPVRGYLEYRRPPEVARQAIYHYRYAEAHLAIVAGYDRALQDARMTYTAPLEWNNVRAAFRWLVAASSYDDQAARLLLTYVHYVRNVFVYNYDPRLQQWLEAAYQAAQRLNDQQAQVEILVIIGYVEFYHNEYNPALANYRAALTLCQTIDAHQIEADALFGIGEVHRMLRDDKGAALTSYNAALALYCALGDRIGQANTLMGIGRVQEILDRHEAAIANFKEALTISREINDVAGEADALYGIGDIQIARRELVGAMANCSHAIVLYQSVGERLGQAEALCSLGDVLCLRRELDAAMAHYDTAIKLHQEIGLECLLAHLGIGNTQRMKGEYDAAITSFTTALVISRKETDLLYEAKSLWSIGDIQRLQGEYDAAAANYQAALKHYRTVNSPSGEANVLASQAQLALLRTDQAEADRLLTEAIEIYLAIDDRYSIAEKLGQYSGVLFSLGHTKQAHFYLQQATARFLELGISDEPPTDHQARLIDK